MAAFMLPLPPAWVMAQGGHWHIPFPWRLDPWHGGCNPQLASMSDKLCEANWLAYAKGRRVPCRLRFLEARPWAIIRGISPRWAAGGHIHF